MSELDKFKRRLIRSVARLLRQDKTPGKEAWEELKKETGCDCKLLWERMKALTLKKVKRMLKAEDRTENIAPVARMSLTDWLLYDLVLVHEKLDVIGRDIKTQENKSLNELFQLVQKYKIEELNRFSSVHSRDRLIDAWYQLTLEYNGKTGKSSDAENSGRKVSPMLLQRRWYQLKEQTRSNFYRLWHHYHGSDRLWDTAQIHKPTQLQAAIAKTYFNVVTDPFPDWEQLIQKGLVILPEVFEMRHRRKNQPLAPEEDKTDVVMIEPVIETIDLGAETDDDTGQSSSDIQASVISETVKQEPEEDGLSNVQILETMHIPVNKETEESEITNLIDREVEKQQLVAQIADFVTDNPGTPVNNEIDTIDVEPDSLNATETVDNVDIEIPDDLIKQKADEYCSKKKETSQVEEVEKVSEVVDEVDDIIKQKADDFVRQVDMKKLVSEVTDDVNIELSEPAAVVNLEASCSLEEDGVGLDEDGVDGVEIVDDGIEYVEDEDEGEYAAEVPPDFNPTEPSLLKTVVKDTEQEIKDEEIAEENVKIDLKLLMNPVVYTTKLDDMIMFKEKSFESIKLVELIESVILESKPVSQTAIKLDIKEVQPKTDQSNVLIDNEIPNVVIEDSTDDDEISEDLKVKPSSYLLQKPRSRTYNPIQLCKNPDFNTRLKRLTAGFFSLSANRQLLRECKPMTIDLHKAFEPKLIEGTLYLKKSSDSPIMRQIKEETYQTSTVLPSAMPVQSLLQHNPEVDLHELGPRQKLDTVDLTKRSKVINLRDLSEIRRINQQLLTAQVPPMRVDTSSKAATVSPPIQTEDENVVKPPTQDDEVKPTLAVEGEVSRTSETNEGLQSVQDSHAPRPKGPTAWRGRGRGRGKGFIPPPRYWPKTRPVPVAWNKVAWNKVASAPEMKLDEFLITIDTLQKMLGKIGYEDPKPQKKCCDAPLKVATEKLNNPTGQSAKEITNSNKSSTVAGENVDSTKKEVKSYKPVTRAPRKRRKRTFCCWSKEKLRKLTSLGTPIIWQKHPCIGICSCCCRLELATVVREQAIRKAEELEKKESEQIALIELDDDDVVEQDESSKDLENKELPRPRLRVISEASLAGRGRPLNVNNVSSRQQYVRTVRPAPTELNPVLKINVSFSPAPSDPPKLVSVLDPTAASFAFPALAIDGSSISSSGIIRTPSPVIPTLSPIGEPTLSPVLSATSSPVVVSTSSPVVVSMPSPVVVPTPSSVAVSALTLDSPKYHLEPRRISADWSLRKFQNKPSKILPAPAPSIRTVKKSIVIDASSMDTNTTTGLQPKETPLFLGKNKILLTTVKFPPNFKRSFLTSEKRPIPKVVPALPVPSGVQLALMASGELTYTVDPGVTLTSEQIAIMPSILVAVKQQIDASQLTAKLGDTTKPIDSLAQSAEVVDLLSSEDSAAQLAEPSILNNSNYSEIFTIEETSGAVSEVTKIIEKGNKTINEDATSNVETTDMVSQMQSSKDKEIPMAVDEITDKLSKLPNVLENKNEKINTEFAENNNLQDIPIVDDKSNDKAINVAENKNTETSIKSFENQNLHEDPITVDDTIDKASEVPSVAVNKKTETNTECVGSRNLLSDLMEMSGISAEDTKISENTPMEPVSAVNADSTQTHSVVRHLASTMDSTTAPQTNCAGNIVPPIVNVVDETCLPAQVEKITHPVLAPENETVNVSQLTPIASLSELKYACEQRGKFFKLDFETGIIVPINVCIKKNSKAKLEAKAIAAKPVIDYSKLVPKACIDLTDDAETPNLPVYIIKDTTSAPTQNPTPIKPVRLFRSAFASQANASILRKKRKHKLLERLAGNLHNLGTIQRARKQDLRKIEAKIDLVDSDAPMEEEYLVESSDSDSEIRKRPQNVATSTPTEDSNDSSDDEPLAKKFVRLKDQVRNAAITACSENTTPPDKNTEETQSTKANSPVINNDSVAILPAEEALDTPLNVVEIPEAVPMDIEPPVAYDNNDPEKDDVTPDNMDTESSQVLTFLEDENDSPEEDCILGV